MSGHATYAPYRGFERPGRKKVYLSSVYAADQLEIGHLVCYKHDATVRDTVTDPNNTFGVTVAKPLTANLMFPAGIVAVRPKKGEGWIEVFDISEAGKFVKAMLKVNVTGIGTIPLGGVNNQYEIGLFTDATVNLALLGVGCEVADTSVTAALKTIKLIGQ
jgi:hypothetical protein